MISEADLTELRRRLAPWRDTQRIAFIPTMGNLHEGHLTLAREARKHAERVVVSIFVNPMQFCGGEDFESYPRTLEDDQSQLVAAGVDLLFVPDVKTIYPRSRDQTTRVEVPGLSDVLCGASRPGHFIGVATVVCKLLNMVQPHLALFGKKDFQQLLVIRRMVEDLNLPVVIHGVDTVRETDGLAMSSRNGYLTAQERSRAPVLYQILQETASQLRRGRRDYAILEAGARATLERHGLTPDYISVRRVADLALPTEQDQAFVVLAAAYLGKARLIDNLEV
jgi:pantoate--beta-alanine ligase